MRQPANFCRAKIKLVSWNETTWNVWRSRPPESSEGAQTSAVWLRVRFAVDSHGLKTSASPNPQMEKNARDDFNAQFK